MGKVADLIKGCKKLKSLDLSETSASGEQTIAILTAFSESQSVSTLQSLPQIEAKLYED